MGIWILEEESKYCAFTRYIAGKRSRKILQQSSETLLYNFGLYILFINIQISSFLQKGLHPGGLASEGSYNGRGLYVQIR